MIDRIRRKLTSAISNLPTEFLKNLKWQYIGNLGAGLLGGLYLLYLGRVLGVTDFGLYALCVSAATLIFGLSDIRIQEALIRFASTDLAEQGAAEATRTVKVLFTLDLAARVVGCAAACALSPFIAEHVVKDPTATPLICLAAVGLLLCKAGYNPSLGVLRLTDRFDLTAMAQLGDWAIRFALTVALSFVVDISPLHVLLVAAVIGGAMNIALILVAAQTWCAKHGAFGWSLPTGVLGKLRSMRRFLASSYGINLLDVVVRDLDTMIIGLFTSVTAVGLYRMVKNVAQLIWRAADPIFLVMMPILSRFILAGDRNGMQTFLRHLTLLSFVAAASLIIGANLIAPPVIRQFLPQFTDSISLIPWMTWWVLIALPLVWTHALAAAAGRPDIQFRASLVGNLLGAVLILTLTPLLSTTGAAIGWSLSLATTFGLGFFLLKRERLL